jgi:hypothetical protein
MKKEVILVTQKHQKNKDVRIKKKKKKTASIHDCRSINICAFFLFLSFFFSFSLFLIILHHGKNRD